MDYVVVGKLSQIDLNEVFNQKIGKIDEKKIKKIVMASLTVLVAVVIQDAVTASTTGLDLANAIVGAGPFAGNPGPYKVPGSLVPILEFIKWLIWLLKVIVSSVIGLIATFAGYKWATDISGSGQSEAKKILKNCTIGTIITWVGAGVADFFVGKLIELLG